MPRPFRLCPHYSTGIAINSHKISILTLKHATNASTIPEVIALQSLTISNTTTQQPRKPFWKYRRCWRQPVIVGLPLARTILKEITLDNTLSDAEIYQHLKQQATKLLGLETHDLYLDYELLTSPPETTQTASRKLRITATPRETVTQLTDRCHYVGCYAQVVDITARGLLRTIPFLTNHPCRHASQAIVSLDENGFTLCVQDPNSRSYFKTLPYPNDATTTHEEDTLKALQSMLQFFLNTHAHLSLTHVWVLGLTTALPTELSINGRANLPLYPAYLNPTHLKISPEHLHEFTTQTSDYLVCLGLALWSQSHEI